MPKVVHVVVTGNFAGAERYVCDVAVETARQGWDVTVVGGQPTRMRAELGPGIGWWPGATPPRALKSLADIGHHDVCHVHMTYAEAVGALARRAHRGLLVATRHFAQHRGQTPAGRLLAPWISGRLDAEIAISRFVADRIEQPPDTVIHNGVPDSPVRWKPESRTVLMLQRLEREKDTATAIEGWRLSQLWESGWSLRLVGDGGQRRDLEAIVRATAIPAVEFAGRTGDVAAEFDHAGLLMASAPAEPFGLSVVEAMAAGVPVVAAAAGGHLEAMGEFAGSLGFVAGDAESAAEALVRVARDGGLRGRLSADLRSRQRVHFSIEECVKQLVALYSSPPPPRRGDR
jgi:glycosyltransferase involved in cell wall biosynthesis